MSETGDLDKENLQLRNYRPDDFEAMFQLDEACFEPPFRFSRTVMKRFAQASNARVVVAEAAAQIAGFCIVHVNGFGNTTRGYIVTLDVAPEHRRKGVARKLMHESEAKAALAGCRAMLLHVFSGNTGAISFYKREGYTFLRVAPGFYGPGVDALVYRKPFLWA